MASITAATPSLVLIVGLPAPLLRLRSTYYSFIFSSSGMID